MIGSARIVALGEASHGTAECFLMKHRLLEYLVERKGFTVLAMEAAWPEAQEADRFLDNAGGWFSPHHYTDWLAASLAIHTAIHL
jgi:erythromycin esterase